MKRVFTLFVLTGLIAGCAREDEPQPADSGLSSGQQTAGFESPAAAFDAFQKAARADDFPAVVSCLSLESQEATAAMASLPLAMVAAFDTSKEGEIKELFGKHGISSDDDEFDFESVPNMGAFIADVMQWIECNTETTDIEKAPLLSGGLTNILYDGTLSAFCGVRGEEGTLGEVTVEGDSARAALTIDSGESDEVEFRCIDGRWFVHFSPEPQFTPRMPLSSEDFEFQSDDYEVFVEGNTSPDPLAAVTREQFDAAWQISLDVKDQTAQNLLAGLADELGLGFALDADIATMLQKPVSLDLAGVSRFEAIESICQQIDVTPVYTPVSLSLEPGKRTMPTVVTGPFLIEVIELDSQTETATGTLSLRAFATGLPPTVLQLLQDGSGVSLDVSAVADTVGRTLLRPQSGVGAWSQTSPAVFDRQISVGLKHLFHSVESLHTVDGSIAFSLPTEVEVLEFNELKKSARQEVGETAGLITEVSGGNFTFEFNGVERDDVQLLAFDENGDRVEPISTGGFGGGILTINNSYRSPVSVRFEARIITSTEPIDYAFSLKDIDVPNHDQMPELLRELSFDGDVPLILEFVDFSGEPNFRSVVFRVTNHANKAAETFFLEMTYLDDAGTELDDSSSIYSGRVIPGGQTDNIEVHAFFMPEATKTVNAMVTSVGFTDASEWKVQHR